MTAFRPGRGAPHRIIGPPQSPAYWLEPYRRAATDSTGQAQLRLALAGRKSTPDGRPAPSPNSWMHGER